MPKHKDPTKRKSFTKWALPGQQYVSTKDRIKIRKAVLAIFQQPTPTDLVS